MAEVLRELGVHMQLLAITHLPQVASSGQQHWKVRKEQMSDHTRTTVLPLSDSERIEEIARLMSSEGITGAARAQARELLAVNESV
jgi:DNA repair protein RecN (Recombination protein N)